MRRTPDRFDYTLVRSTFSERCWNDTEVLPISGVHRHGAPYSAPDGGVLYFDTASYGASIPVRSLGIPCLD